MKKYLSLCAIRNIHFLLFALCIPVRVWRKMLSKPLLGKTTHTTTEHRQLLVDVSVIIRCDVHTGIQRVVKSVFNQLMLNPPDGMEVRAVYATWKHGYHYAPADWQTKSLAGGEVTQKVRAGKGDVFLGLDLSTAMLFLHQPQLMGLKLHGVDFCIMIYDMLPIIHPKWFDRTLVTRFRRWIRAVARLADTVVCISASTQSEMSDLLQHRFSIKNGDIRMKTIPLAPDIESGFHTSGFPDDAPKLLRCMKNNDAVLMVGTIEPRKGHALALEAFESLWAKGRNEILVIVGRPGWKTQMLQDRLSGHREHGKRLFWLDNVSDEYLLCLYSSARVLLMVSEAEGFGLPLIEANRYGIHVLARDIPVFREVMGDAATYFSATTPDKLSEVLQDWLDQRLFDKPPSEGPFYNVSWLDTAQKLVNAICSQPKLESETA